MENGSKELNFQVRRLKQVIAGMTVAGLQLAISEGLNELTALVENKPEGWHEEVTRVGDTLAVIKMELERRGEA